MTVMQWASVYGCQRNRDYVTSQRLQDNTCGRFQVTEQEPSP